MKNLLLLSALFLFITGIADAQTDLSKPAMNTFTAKATDGDVSSANINVWPNPAIGNVNIYVNSIQPGDKGQCVLFNSAGKPCLVNYVRNGNNQLSIGNLPEGFYFLKILLRENVLYTKKLMIAR